MPVVRGGAFVALALLLAACGLGERAGYARVIEAGPSRVQGAVAAGTLGIGFVVDLKSLPPEQRRAAAQRTRGATGKPLITYDVLLDPARRRAAFLRDNKVVVLHEDELLYGRRADAAPDDARPWVMIDENDVNEDEAPVRPSREGPMVGVELINPTLLVELASGALTGSIRNRGTDEIDGARVRSYEANFDLEKVTAEVRRRAYNEDRIELLNKVLDVAAVDGTVHPGRVWLDEKGRLRRFAVQIKRSDDYGLRVNLQLTLDLPRWDATFDVKRPADDELLQLDGFKQFLRAVSVKDKAATLPTIPTTATTALAAQVNP